MGFMHVCSVCGPRFYEIISCPVYTLLLLLLLLLLLFFLFYYSGKKYWGAFAGWQPVAFLAFPFAPAWGAPLRFAVGSGEITRGLPVCLFCSFASFTSGFYLDSFSSWTANDVPLKGCDGKQAAVKTPFFEALDGPEVLRSSLIQR